MFSMVAACADLYIPIRSILSNCSPNTLYFLTYLLITENVLLNFPIIMEDFILLACFYS